MSTHVRQDEIYLDLYSGLFAHLGQVDLVEPLHLVEYRRKERGVLLIDHQLTFTQD